MSGLKKKWSQIFHFEDDSDGGGGGGGFALISTALSMEFSEIALSNTGEPTMTILFASAVCVCLSSSVCSLQLAPFGLLKLGRHNTNMIWFSSIYSHTLVWVFWNTSFPKHSPVLYTFFACNVCCCCTLP